jgi:acyl carrier protein
MMMSDLNIKEIKLEIKKLIIETLNMQNISPDDIKDDIPLLSGENTVKIDSIDVLELVIALQRKFDVRIDDQNLARHIIHTIDTMAGFIYTQKINNKTLSNS